MLYAGMSKHPETRWKQHLTKAKSKRPKSRLAKAMKRYGDFSMYVVAEYPTLHEAAVAELLMIDYLGSEDPDIGYNNAIAWQYVNKSVRQEFRNIKMSRRVSHGWVY